ncbi:class I SAM-dependent methyltransferase [Solirubrobacter ginsenosidimutans]|uniref:Class I SAM-dependent methyltransferase n=1 Tax=Solirubrobacter ginsenosidimutans TaxID=490573 RepID=A0A9X3MVH1_9ACTN|nr:class I SAM-dependent methyltransferase [Solirubrobacter ginsenosidimutans]MDA0160673.1 class I SAM-dependent methyltransferase [Solirubrobacter ginsenosidimutans]
MAARADRRGAAEHRQRLLRGLAGRVVEVGAGHGGNFAHYPPTVTEVVAVEPEPTLRGLAEAAAKTAAVAVTVIAGLAEDLPFADGEFDAAVVSLVLCSVPDQAKALRELRRVLHAQGELRFYEHVIPRKQPKRALFQMADRSGAWPALAAGCHLSRDTGAAIAAAGFVIERLDRIEFRSAALEPRLPYILGTARPGG